MRKIVVFTVLATLLLPMVISNLALVDAKGNEIAMEEFAPSVSGLGIEGPGTISVAVFYSVRLSGSGMPKLGGAVGLFNGSLSNVPDVAGAYQVQAFSASPNGCTLSGTVVIGPFVGQPVTETIFGSCFPSQALQVLVAFEFGDINRPIFAGHGVGALSPITGTIGELLVNGQASGSGTCGTLTTPIFSISIINIPSDSSLPAAGLASIVQAQLPADCIPVSLFVADPGPPIPCDFAGLRFQVRAGVGTTIIRVVSWGISSCQPTGIQPVTVTLQVTETPDVQLFSGQGTGTAALIIL